MEHIVVDPRSSDGSRDILERWRPRLARLILDPDAGPADGLNNGFGAATGEIFDYINADDPAFAGSLAAITSHFAAASAPDMILERGLLIDR